VSKAHMTGHAGSRALLDALVKRKIYARNRIWPISQKIIHATLHLLNTAQRKIQTWVWDLRFARLWRCQQLSSRWLLKFHMNILPSSSWCFILENGEGIEYVHYHKHVPELTIYVTGHSIICTRDFINCGAKNWRWQYLILYKCFIKIK
jgi:hypothetical protein